MVHCSIRGCKSDSEKKIDRLSFHSFPNDPKLRNLWIAATKKINWNPKRSSKICSEHFGRELLWKVGKKTFLHPNAVPAHMPNDMENYMEYHLMGYVSQIRMKRGCMPTKNLCQLDKQTGTSDGQKQSRIVKRKRKTLKKKESQKDFEERNYVTIEVDLAPTISNNSDENKSKSELKEDMPEGRELVVRVYRYLQTEYEQLKQITGNSCDLSPLANILKRTAAATGLTEHTLSLILDEARSDCSEGASDDATPAKRLKMKLSFEDDDDRQKEHEEQEQVDSIVQEQMEQNDYVPEKRLQEQNDYILETLKFEYEDDDYKSCAPHETADTTLATVKHEPVDWDVTDPLHTQYDSLAHETSGTVHVTVKREPEDEE